MHGEIPNKNNHGKLYVFSGPSGVGKGTVLQEVFKRRDNLWNSVSATTRSPRDGEIEGINYYFLPVDEFKDRINNGSFLEWAEYAGNYYGTPRNSVEMHLENGEDVILEIDVQGALQVRESMPECQLVFIEPPSMEELKRRLAGRATECEDSIQKRLHAAELELSRKMEYDITFVNDDINSTVEAICEMLDSNSKA